MCLLGWRSKFRKFRTPCMDTLFYHLPNESIHKGLTGFFMDERSFYRIMYLTFLDKFMALKGDKKTHLTVHFPPYGVTLVFLTNSYSFFVRLPLKPILSLNLYSASSTSCLDRITRFGWLKPVVVRLTLVHRGSALLYIDHSASSLVFVEEKKSQIRDWKNRHLYMNEWSFYRILYLFFKRFCTNSTSN